MAMIDQCLDNEVSVFHHFAEHLVYMGMLTTHFLMIIDHLTRHRHPFLLCSKNEVAIFMEQRNSNTVDR